MFGELVTVECQSMDNVRLRWVTKRHAFLVDKQFVSVELSKVKKYPRNKESLENILKWELKLRSWKKSWEVKEFEELKGVRTLKYFGCATSSSGTCIYLFINLSFIC